MARATRYSPEQIVAKLREYEKLQAQGLTIPQACKGGSANPYDYAYQDPVNGTDLNGDFSFGDAVRIVKHAAHAAREYGLQTVQSIPYGVYAASYYVLKESKRLHVPLPIQLRAGFIVLEAMGLSGNEAIAVLRGKKDLYDDARKDSVLPNYVNRLAGDPKWLYLYLPGLGRTKRGRARIDWSFG